MIFAFENEQEHLEQTLIDALNKRTPHLNERVKQEARNKELFRNCIGEAFGHIDQQHNLEGNE